MKTFLVWFLAVLITLGAVFYQRISGPTQPKRVKTIIDNKEYKLSLIRTHGGNTDAIVKLVIDTDIEATLLYKYYPVLEGEDWKKVNFNKAGNEYLATLPNQPPAGKLMYYINIKTSKDSYDIEKDKPVVIRFKGDVPALVLIPHMLLMFLAMFFSNVSGLMAVSKMKFYMRFSYITFAFLAIGGMILGPIVQYYAFNELWTGVPYGWDLTDNKTLIAFIFWMIAVLSQLKKERTYLTVIASIVMLIVFSIPHSAFGSELDRASGNITQGIIIYFGL